MRFVFRIRGDFLEIRYKSDKEEVYLGTLSFFDSDEDFRPEIRELLLLALITDNPMLVVEKDNTQSKPFVKLEY